MSDATGPFAVPNFSQPDPAEEEEFDDEEEEEEFETQVEPVSAEVADDPSEGDGDAPSAAIDGGPARSVLEHIARSIVDEPDAVRVDASSQRGGVRLDLHVASSDMGRIIGRRGRVAQALRAVVRAAAAKDGTDATVDIVD